MHLTKGTLKSIKVNYQSIFTLTPDFTENSLLITGQHNSTNGIWQQPLNSNEPRLLLRASNEGKINTLSIDEINKNIYYDSIKQNTDINLVSIPSEKINTLSKLNTQAFEYFGIFSKSNQYVYFTSQRNGYFEIWRYDIAQEKTEQVTHLEALNITRAVLSNNEEFIAISYNKENLKLAIINLTTGQAINTKDIPYAKFPLAWSPDDQYIYISEHPNKINLHKYDRETLTPQLIKSDAGLFAFSTQDDIYFIDYSRRSLVKKNLKNNQEIVVTTNIPNLKTLMPGQLCITPTFLMAARTKNNSIKLNYFPLIDNENNLPIPEKKSN